MPDRTTNHAELFWTVDNTIVEFGSAPSKPSDDGFFESFSKKEPTPDIMTPDVARSSPPNKPDVIAEMLTPICSRPKRNAIADPITTAPPIIDGLGKRELRIRGIPVRFVVPVGSGFRINSGNNPCIVFSLA
jgi:hypothetical protein